MGSIDRYIFRTTLASFALVLVSLTGVIWITQALRGIDLMTSQGQTIVTFLGLTSLVIPALILIIAPVALMIAIAYTLNKLNTDSEIVVLNAGGMAPWRLFRPFLAVAIVVVPVVLAIAIMMIVAIAVVIAEIAVMVTVRAVIVFHPAAFALILLCSRSRDDDAVQILSKCLQTLNADAFVISMDAPRIVVGPGSRVGGTLNFERKVSLYVSDRATIGPVQGATAVKYSGERPPD